MFASRFRSRLLRWRNVATDAVTRRGGRVLGPVVAWAVTWFRAVTSRRRLDQRRVRMVSGGLLGAALIVGAGLVIFSTAGGHNSSVSAAADTVHLPTAASDPVVPQSVPVTTAGGTLTGTLTTSHPTTTPVTTSRTHSTAVPRTNAPRVAQTAPRPATSKPTARAEPVTGTTLVTHPWRLAAGHSIKTNVLSLTMQSDGNLVLLNSSGHALWSTGTQGTADYATFQGDGNLVVYTKLGSPLWESATHDHPGATLLLQGNGNMAIESAGSTIWQTNTRV